MDALHRHLDTLASVGSRDSQGSFTLAESQVWNRLRQALPDGRGSLRFLLRWLHARGASAIAVLESRDALEVIADFKDPSPLPNLGQGQEWDLAGLDLDLARGATAAQMLELPVQVAWDDGNRCYRKILPSEDSWALSDGSGKAQIRLTYRLSSRHRPRVTEWEALTKTRFRASPCPLSWNGTPVSGPYAFSVPVLVWRHLRPLAPSEHPMLITNPRTAIESYRTTRHQRIDVVLGMLMGMPSGDRPEFELLKHGELLPLEGAENELAGFGGLIRADHQPLDLGGDRPVWNDELNALVATFKDEAVDMALQLYRREPSLEPREAASVFLGMQSVLLHLLDQQRFTEGHILAEWLRPKLDGSTILQGFHYGYTFDRICALLAEPAGHPQTSIRWRRSAEERARAQAARSPGIADDALLIAARLELRARRDQPEQLSGDTQGKLSQLAFRQDRRGLHKEAAEISVLLAMALPPGHPQRREHLIRAATSGRRAGLPHYASLLDKERIAAKESSRPQRHGGSAAPEGETPEA